MTGLDSCSDSDILRTSSMLEGTGHVQLLNVHLILKGTGSINSVLFETAQPPLHLMKSGFV